MTQLCLAPSPCVVIEIISLRYIWNGSQGLCDNFAGHTHCLCYICSGRGEGLKSLLSWNPASLLSPPALLHVVPVLTGIQPSLAFPFGGIAATSRYSMYCRELLFCSAWPDVEETPAWAWKRHCYFSGELWIAKSHLFSMLFNLAWSSS